MKSTTYATLLASAGLANAVALFPRADTCNAISNVQTTFYGFPDNSPPGAGTSYSCAGRDSTAGGTGTHADPLTFATAPGEFSRCEVIYAPYLKKYLVFQDECAQCTSDWAGGKKYHVDVWTGSSTQNGGDAQVQCENSLTPDAQMVLRNPPADLEVDAGELFAGGKCDKSHVYDGNKASCAGGAGASTPVASSSSAAAASTTGKAPASTATGTGAAAGGSTCEWAGHCAGAVCKTDDDCSGSLTCGSGKCAA